MGFFLNFIIMRRKKNNCNTVVANFRRLMPLLALFVCLSCSKNDKLENSKEITEETTVRKTKANAVTDPNEQNANKNWKWDDPNLTKVNLYFKPKINGQPSPSIERPLPWNTFGNPLNNSDKDYRSELGWVLYLKDFGTPDRPAQAPFFALYNIYSGVLRFFVYNYRVQDLNEGSKTHYIAKLSYAIPDQHNGMLSFSAPPDQFIIDKEDRDLSLVSVTRKNASDVWMNFDFVMAKPSPYKNSTNLVLSVFGVNETELNLGSDFSTLTAKSSIGGAGKSGSDFAKFINGGVEYTTSGGALVESINKLKESFPDVKAKVARSTKAESNLETSRLRAAIPIATVAAGIGVIKGLFGFVKSFVGGSKSATNTQTSLQYNGIVKTTGTANLTNNLYNIQFYTGNNSLSPSYYVPLYDYTIGLIPVFESENGINSNWALHLKYDEILYQCHNGWPYEPVRQGQFSIQEQSIFPILSHFTNDEVSDLVNRVRLDSVKLTLLNRRDFGDGYANSFNYMPYKVFDKYEPYNEGITVNSVNSGWRKFFPYYQQSPSSIFYIKKFYHDQYANNTGYYSNGFTTDQKFRPAIGIYIKFTITDPKYPNNESRERVIFKVVDTEFKGGSRDYPGKSGCPVVDYNN
ncbi:Uncharacterised protein [Sphingobacterium thalpophilum]|uniref:Uncharacterized protein n=2 Tax=Sphingobacterium thalpophilum TaxID=259 RepID=A0A4U9VC62_9SPHI|nr:Uncharacterised protein [Sphingobacterium thalpophilum]